MMGNITISSIEKRILRFPGLKSAGVVTLKGNVSTFWILDKRIADYYSPVGPSLKSCGSLTAWGNISELLMPNFIGGKDTHEPISIDVQTIYKSSVPINFDALTNAADIYVNSFVEPLHMPVLANPLPPSPPIPKRVPSSIKYIALSTAHLSVQSLITLPQYSQRRMVTTHQNMKVGLGFGLGLGGGLAAVIGFVWLLRWIRKRKAGKSPRKEGDKGGENAEGQINATTRSETEGDSNETTKVETTVRSSRELEIRVNSIEENSFDERSSKTGYLRILFTLPKFMTNIYIIAFSWHVIYFTYTKSSISSPQNFTSKDDNTCCITDIDNPWRDSMQIIALVTLVVLGIYSFVHLIISRYEVHKLEKNLSSLRFETMDDRVEQLRNHERKIRTTLFEDYFQQDASQLAQIRDLQNTTIVFERGAMNHFADGFEAAKREACEILQREFSKRYEVEPSQVKRKRHGGFGPVLKYSQRNRPLMTDLMDVDEIFDSL
ncbi:uncharacterized protein EAF02_001553 [Botrytis sinoallii]|uniref:uncharacterized protein n=1 Tax=Botrytis sinoallii TaxID=1463999 RepID=UPI00190257F8|nr:uncharacterized protein EAF02_001553 [Botrytis sinoallii]KAF7891228.1 hypothetical protein EAF02_001553 [Botrytis sinoallii]